MSQYCESTGVANPRDGDAEEHARSPSPAGTSWWRRRSTHIMLLAALVPLIAWRAHADRGYWQRVIAERTLFPSCDCVDCTVTEPVKIDLAAPTEAELVAWQQPQGSAFDLSELTIPRGDILSGGPPTDGIPALTDPKFVPAGKATYLGGDDRVIGVVIGGEARAYPLAILNHHEVVNDRIGKVPLAVTYCPLCDSAAVFDRQTPLGGREFGVSGLLHNSNVLLYDRGGKPESLWSQIKAAGVSGPGAKQELKTLPLEVTTWKAWTAEHPATQVLSESTRHRCDYRRNPYAGYFRTAKLMFPAKPLSERLPVKAKVLGVWTDSAARAYPVSAFSKNRTQVEDTIDGKKVVIKFSPESESLRVVEAGEGVEWMYSLWFAWYAFRPETQVFQ